MEPEVITTYTIYPMMSDNLMRYVLTDEFTDPELAGLGSGYTLQYEERKDDSKPFKVKWRASLDKEDLQAFHNCIGKLLSNTALPLAAVSDC